MQLKQLLCAFFACTILFAACKKDDETSTDNVVDETSTENVVGTWDAVTYVNTNCNDSTEDGTVDAALLACTDPNAILCTEVSYVFKDDGTFDTEITAVVFGVDASQTLSGTYTVSGDEVELCITGADCLTATIAGDQMTITTTDDPESGCDTDTILEKQ